MASSTQTWDTELIASSRKLEKRESAADTPTHRLMVKISENFDCIVSVCSGDDKVYLLYGEKAMAAYIEQNEYGHLYFVGVCVRIVLLLLANINNVNTLKCE